MTSGRMATPSRRLALGGRLEMGVEGSPLGGAEVDGTGSGGSEGEEG